MWQRACNGGRARVIKKSPKPPLSWLEGMAIESYFAYLYIIVMLNSCAASQMDVTLTCDVAVLAAPV